MVREKRVANTRYPTVSLRPPNHPSERLHRGVRYYVLPLLLLAACGTRSGLAVPVGDAGCLLPRYSPDAAFTMRACGSTCTLFGTDDRGAAIRFECDGQRCQFFVTDVPSCECTDIDFANTCSNGVPLCRSRSNFNFVRSESLPCGDR